jgi:hypothetical protein
MCHLKRGYGVFDRCGCTVLFSIWGIGGHQICNVSVQKKFTLIRAKD